LERQLSTKRLVIGSTQLLTAGDFLNNLVPQPNKKSKPLIEDADDDNEESKEVKPKKKKSKLITDDEEGDNNAIELEDIQVSRKVNNKKKKQEDNDDEADIDLES
jgi:hypothetical protein